MFFQKIRFFSVTRRLLGLEDYFDSPKGWTWGEKELPTGRAWIAPELRIKSFEDLHGLWWNCLKERNKLESQKQEARRFQIFFPHSDRMHQVRLTMNRIKHVLWERRIAYMQAKAITEKIAKKQKLLAEGISKSEVEAKMKELDIASVGRKPKKVKRLSRPNKRPADNRATSWTIV